LRLSNMSAMVGTNEHHICSKIVRLNANKLRGIYMNRLAVTTTLLILASVLAIHFANGASSPDRPAGVNVQNWIPVSDKMGFVVTTPQSVPGALVTTDRQPLLLAPPAEGYFMVRSGIGWQRITIKDPLKGPGSSG
jgi:hypothetical protein